MPTCRKHGSGGDRNAKIGLVRYLCWIIIGCPQDTPWPYAKFAAMSAALEMMFNHGMGTPDQRLRAALWIADTGYTQGMIVDNSVESVDKPLVEG